jgi:hypothetical protein
MLQAEKSYHSQGKRVKIVTVKDACAGDSPARCRNPARKKSKILANAQAAM